MLKRFVGVLGVFAFLAVTLLRPDVDSSAAGSKQSFFEKKNQKAFAPTPTRTCWLCCRRIDWQKERKLRGKRHSKSFLVLFLEKGLLACLDASTFIGVDIRT